MNDFLIMQLVAKEKIADLHREAAAARLADEFRRAQPQGKSLRSRVADGLHALAERIDGVPQLTPAEA